jgi:hypothetical protein
MPCQGLHFVIQQYQLAWHSMHTVLFNKFFTDNWKSNADYQFSGFCNKST